MIRFKLGAAAAGLRGQRAGMGPAARAHNPDRDQLFRQKRRKVDPRARWRIGRAWERHDIETPHILGKAPTEARSPRWRTPEIQMSDRDGGADRRHGGKRSQHGSQAR